MIWLILGLALWSGVHLIPIAARPFRARLIERLGAQPYQGVFALAIVTSIVLMVVGWRSTPPVPVYLPPAWGRWAAFPLVLVGFVLFAASALPCNIKRVLRHPQLTGVATWAGAHLLANGESRSLWLFAGLGVWAVVAMLGINRRDGAWERPGPLPLSADAKPVLAGVVAFAVLFASHAFIFGVSPMPG